MPVTRKQRATVERFTIWDNFEWHKEELQKLGAASADIAELRAAAEKVEAEERAQSLEHDANPGLDDARIEDLTQPYTCANGWTIARPTKAARRWAAVAMLRVTGGADVSDPIGVGYAVLAGLWALKTWGEGARDVVMQTITRPGELAELLTHIEDQVAAEHLLRLPDDLTALLVPEKKSPAWRAWRETIAAIRARLSAPSTRPSSALSPAPASGSA